MRTYIIRLPNNELSVSLAKETADSASAIGVDTEYFEGVDKEDAKKFFNDNSIRLAPEQKGMKHWSPGTMGCFASHYSLWKMCDDANEPFTILEHDAIVLRNPENILDDVDDVCHLDYCLPFNSTLPEDSEVYFPHYETAVTKYRPGVVDYPRNTFYDTQSVTGHCFRGAYGYIIRPYAARRIMRFINNYGAFPADRCICDRVVKLQKSACTYVRLNPFFKTLKAQRMYSTRT